MPYVRDDEKRYLILLKPMFRARIVSSALAVIGLAVAVFKYNLLSVHAFAVLTIGIIAVNYLSFYFIKKNFPIKAFSTMNGGIFIFLITIGIHYTGGERSPIIIFYVVLIMIVAIISNSRFVTISMSVLTALALDAVVALEHYGVLASKPFFIGITVFFNEEINLLYSMAIWNVFLVLCGIFFGYTSSLLGIIRIELQTANDENVRMQGIVRKLVSKSAWDDASEAARKSVTELVEHDRVCTVMFTDIVGFSAISEKMPPAKVVGMLNRHFDTLGEIIYHYGGDIDKFIGDATMVVFEEATDAVDAAVAIQRELSVAARKYDSNDPLSKLKIRIGINTGEVVAGSMGTAERMDRSLIGDEVNVAQRLESMAKPGYVLVSAATFKAVGRGKYKFRRVGIVRIKGKKRRIAAYSLDPANCIIA